MNPPEKSLEKRIVASAAIAALSLAVAIPAAPAFAAVTGTLVVDLVTPAGAPIDTAGLAIYTYSIVGSPVIFHQESESDASGVITVSDVPAEKIDTEAPPEDGYAPAEKKSLTVVAGKTLTVRLVLAKGGIIKGLVTDGGTSTALAGAEVKVLDSSGNSVASGYSDSDGSYSVGGLPTGKYRVHFNSKVEKMSGAPLARSHGAIGTAQARRARHHGPVRIRSRSSSRAVVRPRRRSRVSTGPCSQVTPSPARSPTGPPRPRTGSRKSSSSARTTQTRSPQILALTAICLFG